MKKRRGRPPKDRLPPLEELPSWALKRIQEISKDSGVDPRRIRDHALKSGLYEIRNKYDGAIESYRSADTLFNSSEQTIERDRPARDTSQAIIDNPDELGGDREIAEMPEPEAQGADQNGSVNVTFEQRLRPAYVEADRVPDI